jgi:hypothetical protein
MIISLRRIKRPIQTTDQKGHFVINPIAREMPTEGEAIEIETETDIEAADMMPQKSTEAKTILFLQTIHLTVTALTCPTTVLLFNRKITPTCFLPQWEVMDSLDNLDNCIPLRLQMFQQAVVGTLFLLLLQLVHILE